MSLATGVVLAIGITEAATVLTTFACAIGAGVVYKQKSLEESLDQEMANDKFLTENGLKKDDLLLLKAELEKYKGTEDELLTAFDSKDILIEVLEECGGYTIKEDGDKIIAKSSKGILEFQRPDETSLYTLKITACKETDKVIQELSEIYGYKLQDRNYQNIMENLQEENIQIETQEVLEDNTIVLTINLE